MAEKREVQEWQPGLYDQKLGFVAEYGKGLVEILNARPGERILDLGCGTGDLTKVIADSGADAVGMDLSVPMIEQARSKYPGLDFRVGNAESFQPEEPFDAVFSNAALHWMRNARGVADSVWNALKPGGRFVAELGGKGNVAAIIRSLAFVLERDYGVDAGPLNPWYFPALGEYCALLEEKGFRVVHAAHFDRPTSLGDDDEGLIHWLNGFAAGSYLKDFDEPEKKNILLKTVKSARGDLFRDGHWYADYVRLRVVAVKPKSSPVG
ncbi:class I SAM-dependent methyltransferase [Paenibacillus sp. DYY-L-2]|uniref:class I SAM-dependent methyltransferase n=1 Tax=Paenibacillus sp. DYY-L-2 TaxID=3447013 RepID=UPI003F4F5B88